MKFAGLLRNDVAIHDIHEVRRENLPSFYCPASRLENHFYRKGLVRPLYEMIK